MFFGARTFDCNSFSHSRSKSQLFLHSNSSGKKEYDSTNFTLAYLSFSILPLILTCCPRRMVKHSCARLGVGCGKCVLAASGSPVCRHPTCTCKMHRPARRIRRAEKMEQQLANAASKPLCIVRRQHMSRSLTGP